MNTFIEAHGRARIARIVFCILTVLLIAEGVIVYMAYATVSYGDTMLRLGQRSDTSIVMSDAAGEILLAEFAPPEHAPHVTDFGFYCIVTYLDKRIRYSRDLTKENANSYTFSDGSVLDFTHIVAAINGEPDYGAALMPLQESEMALIERICDYYFQPKSFGQFALASLAGLILLILGVRSFFYPEKVWRWRHILSVAGGEPTELYIAITKVLGALWAAFAFALQIIL